MLPGYQKSKKRISKKVCERHQHLLEEEIEKKLVSDIDIFLKKKRKRSGYLVVNDIKILIS